MTVESEHPVDDRSVSLLFASESEKALTRTGLNYLEGDASA